MADATIYHLDGRIIRDAGLMARRSAAAIARRLQTSVIVEDWTACRRYRVTRNGHIRPAPRTWIPAAAWTPEPSFAAMLRDPARFARELALYQLQGTMLAKYRRWIIGYDLSRARAKRARPDLYS